MTSEKRSWYEGATYHITARGHHRNDIFRDEEDFKIYLIILEEALLYFNNYNYEIIAYCLMDNHVHLLLKTGVEPPWRFIARVHSSKRVTSSLSSTPGGFKNFQWQAYVKA